MKKIILILLASLLIIFIAAGIYLYVSVGKYILGVNRGYGLCKNDSTTECFVKLCLDKESWIVLKTTSEQYGWEGEYEYKAEFLSLSKLIKAYPATISENRYYRQNDKCLIIYKNKNLLYSELKSSIE